MTGPVICGVDDSGSAVAAVAVARELAGRYGLPLVFVHALDPGANGEEADAAAGLLRNVAAASDGASWTIVRGHPADRLVELADERRAAFAVVGCHGPHSSLLGSVSADVSRRAACPVVVVPPAAARPAAAEPLDGDVAGGLVRFAPVRRA